MDQRSEILKHGEYICQMEPRYTGLNNRRYAEKGSTVPAKYILAEERFVSGHDDTAGFIEIIDAEEKVIRSWKFDYPMKKRFSDPDYYDDDCLVLYLMETMNLPAVGYRVPK